MINLSSKQSTESVIPNFQKFKSESIVSSLNVSLPPILLKENIGGCTIQISHISHLNKNITIKTLQNIQSVDWIFFSFFPCVHVLKLLSGDHSSNVHTAVKFI